MQLSLYSMNSDSVMPTVQEQIEFNPAWIGTVSGLSAEKLLKDAEKPYLYLLRKGEVEDAYYVTFVQNDFSIKHTPFTLITTPGGWCYRNTGNGGPFAESTIDDVIHLIMHCHKDECTPYIN